MRPGPARHRPLPEIAGAKLITDDLLSVRFVAWGEVTLNAGAAVLALEVANTGERRIFGFSSKVMGDLRGFICCAAEKCCNCKENQL